MTDYQMLPIRRLRHSLLRFAAFALSAAAAFAQGGQVLYNGITLPSPFPPVQGPSQDYRVPSYLTSPPAVIPIDVGRQLFVDDFLIQQTTLTRTPHRPVLDALNPILTPNSEDTAGFAMPFSGGVWFDPADSLFKMWLLCGPGNTLCYAYSPDGKNWIRPSIPDAAIPYTDQVLVAGPGELPITDLVVWMDLEDPNPARKFKAFASNSYAPALLYFSPDGIHWTSTDPALYPIAMWDRTTYFWNPFRKVWVDSLKAYLTLPAAPTRPAYDSRIRLYGESADLMTWTPTYPRGSTNYWIGPDVNDPTYVPGGALPQLYNLDAVAYESLMVGLFSWFHPGPGDDDPNNLPGPDLVELGVGFSRDGFQWVRPSRGNGPAGAFIPASNIPGTWDMANTQSAGGCFLVVGDELWFYFSGRDGRHADKVVGGTGLARLRRDGFYSMNAGATPGVLTTRPVKFSGKYLFVNVNDLQGSLQVQVLDAGNGAVLASSLPLSVDKTRQPVSWSGGLADLSAFANRPVQFRFTLTNGELYSFWVSAGASGASNGYVAAGGPGLIGPTDRFGSGPYPARVTATGGTPQSAATSTAFALPLQVTVVDRLGAGVPNVVVSFSAPASGASAVLSSGTAVTNALGIATVIARANTSAGTYTVTASVETLSTAFALSNFAMPSKLVFTAQPPGSAFAGTALGAVVQIQDAGGNLVTSSAQVTIASAPAGVGGALTANAVNGVATFSALVFATPGVYTLRASSPGLTDAISRSVNVSAAPQTWELNAVPPLAPRAGSSECPGTCSYSAIDVGWLYTPSTSLSVHSIQTRFASTSGWVKQGPTPGLVTLEIYRGLPASGGTLLRSATFSPQAGTYAGPESLGTDVTLNAGTAYFIAFFNVQGMGTNEAYQGSTPLPRYYGYPPDATHLYPIGEGVTAPTLRFVLAGSGAPAGLAFTTQPPGSAAAGTTLGTVVQIQDGSGKPVNSNAPVTIASSPAGVGGTLTMNAVNGVATFSALVLGTPGSYTLRASSPGLTDAFSNPITVSATPGAWDLNAIPPLAPRAGSSECPAPCAYSAIDVGWLYTPATDLTVHSIHTRFASTSGWVKQGPTPGLVALEIYLRGTLLRSATFLPQAGAYAGPENLGTDLILKAGTTYFIAFFNVQGLGTNEAYQGPAILPRFYGSAPDAGHLYPISGGTTAPALRFVLSDTAAVPARLAFSRQPPGSVMAGTPLGAVVQIQNAGGNLVNSNVPVTIVSSPAGVSGTLTVNAVSGVATFNSLVFGAPGVYMLRASSPGLTDAVTGTITVSVPQGPWDANAIPPLTPRAGSSECPGPCTYGAIDVGWLYTPATTLTVHSIRTRFASTSDWVKQGSTPGLVTLEIYQGLPTNGGILLRSGTFSPQAGAYAGPDSLGMDVTLNAGTTYFIAFFNVQGLGSNEAYQGPALLPRYYGTAPDGGRLYPIGGGVTAPTLRFVLGDATAVASRLAFSTQPPGGVIAGTPVTVAVQIQDASGIPVNSTAPVTIASSPAGVTGALTGNAVNGVATFGGLVFGTPGVYTLRASSPGLTDAVTAAITVSAPAPDTWDLNAVPPLAPRAGSSECPGTCSYSAIDVGWVYTPSTSLSVHSVQTRFASTSGWVKQGPTPDLVTLEIYQGLPASGGTLLRSATFSPRAGAYAGPESLGTDVTLNAGTTYFIAFFNVQGLGTNEAYQGSTTLPRYYGTAPDGGRLYPIGEGTTAPTLHFVLTTAGTPATVATLW